MAKLGDFYKITSGGTPSRSHEEYYENGSIPWVKTGDLKSKYLFQTEEKISELGVNNSSARIYPANTVLLAMYGATIGATSILKINAATNQACAAFVPREDILPEYLYAFLESRKERFIKDAVGGAQPNLSASYLKRVSFDCVSLEKQKNVTRVLNRVYNLISLRKQQLTKLDELVKARFVEMFGDLASPACSWKKEKIVNICADQDDIKCGPFGTQLSKDEYQSAGVAVWEIPQINSNFLLKPTHFITAEKALQLESYSIIPGDIAMSRKGNVGRCAVFSENLKNGIIHSDVLRIRIDKKRAVPTFMMHQLHNSNFIKHQIELVSSGAIMAGINVTKLKEIEVHLPPLTLQNEFATFVERVDQQKQTVQQSLEKLELMKKALMQEYFG